EQEHELSLQAISGIAFAFRAVMQRLALRLSRRVVAHSPSERRFIMFRRLFAMAGLPALTMLVSVLVSGPAAAQNQGYSVWAHRNGGGGGGGGGFFRSRSYEPA